MRELTCVIGRFGAWLGMAAFGVGLTRALLAGVDPLYAVVRAGGLAAALVAFYALMCRALVAWLDPGPAARPGASAAAPGAKKETAGNPKAAAAPLD